MKTSLSRRCSRLRGVAVVAGVVVLLAIAPIATAAPGPSPESGAWAGPQVLSRLGDWTRDAFDEMKSLWQAAGCRIDPDGTPCASAAPPAEDGESCDPTTEAGCRIDPDG